ncbi:MAG: hypothetical protein P8Y10_10185 [Gemmatimonadales bacterium]|jgi:hypothetical protein
MNSLVVLRRKMGGAALVPLLMLAAYGSLQAQDAVRLRLDSSAGESLTYKFELNLDIAVPPELGGNQRLESLMVLQQTTQDVRGDTLYFDSAVEDARFSLRSEEGAEMLPDASGELVGQNFTTAFTRRAEPVVIEIDGQSPQANAQIRSALRQGGFPTLPERAVRVGDRWKDTVRIRAAEMGMAAPGFLVLINDISLQRLSRSGSSTIADILVETAYGFEPDRNAFPGVSVEVTGSRADNVRFDVTRGHFLSARGAQDFTMSLTVPGLGQAFAVRGNGESSAGLVD